MADFLVGYHTPLGREYLANLVTGLLVEVMTNSISANTSPLAILSFRQAVSSSANNIRFNRVHACQR